MTRLAKPVFGLWAICCILLLILTLVATRQTVQLRKTETALRHQLKEARSRRDLLEQEVQVRSRFDVLAAIVADGVSDKSGVLDLAPPRIDRIITLEEFSRRAGNVSENAPNISVHAGEQTRPDKSRDPGNAIDTILPDNIGMAETGAY